MVAFSTAATTAAAGTAAAAGTGAAAAGAAAGTAAAGTSLSTYLSIGSLLSSGVGTIMRMQGQAQQAQAMQASANYQAAVARNNQMIANFQAQDALERGKIAARRSRMATAQLKGRQRTAQAGMGVIVDEDSSLDLLGDTAELGMLDELGIQANAEREAFQLRSRAQNFGNEAALLNLRVANAPGSGALGTAVSGLGSVASKWYSFRKA